MVANKVFFPLYGYLCPVWLAYINTVHVRSRFDFHSSCCIIFVDSFFVVFTMLFLTIPLTNVALTRAGNVAVAWRLPEKISDSVGLLQEKCPIGLMT
jgi:hypothetical protein